MEVPDWWLRRLLEGGGRQSVLSWLGDGGPYILLRRCRVDADKCMVLPRLTSYIGNVLLYRSENMAV